MTDSSDISKEQIPTAAPTAPWVKVVLLWLIIALPFALFNWVHFPRYQHQQLRLPESFPAYAENLPEDYAMEVLRQGVAQFNPPWDVPYLRLAALEQRRGNDQKAAFLTARARWYSLLSDTPVDREALSILTREQADAYIDMSRFCGQGIPVAAASFCKALDLSGLSDSWSVARQIALFTLSGSAVAAGTWQCADEAYRGLPLVCYSGGGRDKRRGVHIFVGDQDLTSRERGMHVVFVDAKTGTAFESDCFDLWGHMKEGLRMIQVLEGAPEGCIGLFAVCDEASVFMTNAMESALLQFGIDKTPIAGGESHIIGLRSSFAAIGIKGAPSGTALQSRSPEYFQGRRGHPVICALFPVETTP